VVASEVIEHVDNPEFFVETCTSLLNPGIFISKRIVPIFAETLDKMFKVGHFS